MTPTESARRTVDQLMDTYEQLITLLKKESADYRYLAEQATEVGQRFAVQVDRLERDNALLRARVHHLEVFDR